MTFGRTIIATAAIASSLQMAGCAPPGGSTAKAATKATPPAKVEKLPTEAELTTITLTADAESRLGVVVAPIEAKSVGQMRQYGGDITISPGRAVIVSSPVAGSLVLSGAAPLPGQAVKKGKTVFGLLPILAPEAKATLRVALVDAEGMVKQEETLLSNAKINFNRAENLLRDKAAGAAQVVDAKAQVDLAAARHNAATTRRDLLDKTIRNNEAGLVDLLEITAPSDGVLRTVSVQPGQKVSAGAPLFEVVSLDPINIRVPVFVGDLPTLDIDAEAGMANIGDPQGTPTKPAHRAEAPPSADALAVTADLFYEVENKGGALRPGQRVTVMVPLKSSAQGLVVPRSAIVNDFHGDAWVYENIKPHVFARRRVQVDRVVGDLAILGSGPKVGTNVATQGVAELFGTDMGFSK